MKNKIPFNPTQEDLRKAVRPEERGKFWEDQSETVGWCECGVLTHLGIGCGYICSKCQIKKYGKLVSTQWEKD